MKEIHVIPAENRLLDNYFNTAVKEKLYSSNRHLKFKTSKLFEDVELKDKTILDIGGGDGLFSIYAACSGAEYVVCLEPEGEGSYGKMNDNFERFKKSLQLTNILLLRKTFQDYDAGNLKFDVVLLHNSINHLNEQACENLLKETEARKLYLSVIKKLFEITNNGAQIIISDCSNKNFFAKHNIKNIFAPTIEWNKHQQPETWAEFFRESGFQKVSISWNSPKQLGHIGNLFLGNKYLSYFLGSHFRLLITKP